jgi:hypothetical protein
MTLAMLVAAFVREPPGADGLFFVVAQLAFALVSAVLVVRVPESRVSWTLLGISLGITALIGGTAWGGDTGDLISGLALFAILLPGLGVLLPLWFPTGAPPTRRWRWVAWLGGTGAAAILAGTLVYATLEGGGSADIVGCQTAGSCVSIVGLLALLAAITAAVASFVVRWFRSRNAERRQLKWLVLPLLAFLVGALAEFGGFQDSIVADIGSAVGSVLIPVAIGVAVTRYRLYDIDRIISRTVNYLVVAVILAAVFAGVAVLPTVVVGSGEAPAWLVAGATLTIAALFNPVRRRVQRSLDWRFHRLPYVADEVVGALTGRLRSTVEPRLVTGAFVETAAGALNPASIGVWTKAAVTVPERSPDRKHPWSS